MRLIKILFILIFLSFPVAILAQEGKGSDEQLAVEYYRNKEFDKAAVYYERLFEKTGADFYYGYFLDCLLELKDFKKAEKLVRRQIKKAPYAPAYAVDLGYVFTKAGEFPKAKKEYEGIIGKLTENQTLIYETANAFLKREEADLALATYEKGRKLFKGGFNFEIAELYYLKGDFNAMVGEYLELLTQSEGYAPQVQNYLQRIFGNENTPERAEILRNQLAKRIQKYPDKPVFSELLIWQLVMEKDFNAAFIQVRALDKRFKEDGLRVLNLAQTAQSNKDFDVAAKAYQYLIDKGKEHPIYVPAKIELLKVLNLKITEQAQYTNEDLITLEKNYNSTLAELGIHARTAPLMKELASLYAFYLHNNEKAIELLEECLKIPGVQPYFKAEVKLLLGDIFLIDGEIWESSLLYSQVEKDFKHDPVGDEAKLRNAKVSYYTSDFGWAQGQLDVLKGSTSKLIANDAMRLSLLITDNTTVDTNLVPLEMFAKADLLIFQNKLPEALLTLDSINTYFPAHALEDDILWTRAIVMEKKQNWTEATKYLMQIVEAFGYDILADDALYKAASIYEYQLKDFSKASELYQRLITDYPGSTFIVEARKRFRELRGDKLN
jgi:tetratricopeptide (TPR) repeat protein